MAIHVLGKRIKSKLSVIDGLTRTFYGLGSQQAAKISAKIGLFPQMKVFQLTEQHIMLITKELSELTIDNAARNNVRANIAFKRKIGAYSGMRHAMGLPVHGQNTRNNAQTAKKLNRIARRGFSTMTPSNSCSSSSDGIMAQVMKSCNILKQ